MKLAALTTFALLLCVASVTSAEAATNLTKTSYLTNASGSVAWNSLTATDSGPYSCVKPTSYGSALMQSGETWTVTLTRSNSSGKVTPLQFPVYSTDWPVGLVTITAVPGPGGPTPPAFPATLYLVKVQNQSITAGVETLSLQGEDISEASCIHGTAKSK
jgi:hypothetical protein